MERVREETESRCQQEAKSHLQREITKWEGEAERLRERDVVRCRAEAQQRVEDAVEQGRIEVIVLIIAPNPSHNPFTCGVTP